MIYLIQRRNSHQKVYNDSSCGFLPLGLARLLARAHLTLIHGNRKPSVFNVRRRYARYGSQKIQVPSQQSDSAILLPHQEISPNQATIETLVNIHDDDDDDFSRYCDGEVRSLSFKVPLCYYNTLGKIIVSIQVFGSAFTFDPFTLSR